MPVSECIARYRDPKTFLQTFNPSLQRRYCADLVRAYTGSAPSLTIAAKAFGADTADLWIAAQVRDLVNYSGCREKVTAEQYAQIADVIFSGYAFLKVTELMHFFLRFKLGIYGRFYGAVDPMLISEGLRKFTRERAALIDACLSEQRRRRQHLADQADLEFRRARAVCHMPIQEWLALRAEGITLSTEETAEIGWLFRMGYERKTY